MTARPDRETGAARRAAAILETVERTATGILDEAEEEARRHVENVRRRAEGEAAERLRGATGLTEELVERAERLRGELDGLIEALGEARERLGEVMERPVPAPFTPPAPVEASAPAEPEPQPEPGMPDPFARPPGPGLRPVPDSGVADGDGADGDSAGSLDRRSISTAGARLLATQMAMAGDGRAAVAARLEKELAGEEANRILDAVFGSEE